jgi:RNA polymerase sigma factor (sigma-70 family)
MTEFAELLAGCRRGDAAALTAVVERYLPHVRQAVRRQLSATLRARFDSTDFTQNVWVSFLQLTIARLDLPDEQALVAYLAKMAENKVREEGRHQTTAKQNIRREVSLAAVGEVAGTPATPSAEVMAGDRWAALTAGLSHRERVMVRMLREGHTQEAVAERLGLTARTVRRLLARLRDDPPTGEEG